jgi:hypothetical protein
VWGGRATGGAPPGGAAATRAAKLGLVTTAS